MKRSNQLPKDIPHTPDAIYKNDWENWGVFLGTRNKRRRHDKLIMLSYKKAKSFAQKLNLKNAQEWFLETKKTNFPENIPVGVNSYYKEFEGFGIFLGTGYISTSVRKSEYAKFNYVKSYIKNKKIKNSKEWKNLIKNNKLPKNFPKFPDQTYSKDWKGWGYFLNNPKLLPSSKRYMSYQDAIKFVRKKNIKNAREWQSFTKSNNFPEDLPVALKSVYKNQFKSLGDFLGTGAIASQNMIFLDYTKAKKIAQKLKLKSSKDWQNLIKKNKIPKNLPKAPQNVYKKEFEGWGEFLGTGNSQGIMNRNYLKFSEVKNYAKIKKIKNRNEWISHCQKNLNPSNIPQIVNIVYQNSGWKGWDDFLGTSKFVTFKEAKEYARKIGVNGWSQWNIYFKKNKRPIGIPAKPFSTYKKEWKGWKDFLGTG